MAWIEVHQELPEHPKLEDLADGLGVLEAQAIGHLVKLWLWGIRYSKDGNLAGMTPQRIARYAGYPGDPDEFVAVLVRTGWLDRVRGGLFIHDWMDYAGRLIKKREEDAERKRNERKSKKAPNSPASDGPTDVQRTSNGQSTDKTRTVQRTSSVPNLTVPNPTLPTEPIDHVPPAGATDPPPKPKPEFHPEADRLANLLADLIQANGSKRPRVTDAWRDAIDKLIRIDKRAPSDIERAIRWSQAHHFWRSNILSAAKLREKYDTMRLQAIDQAKAQAKPQERTASNGNDPDQASGEPGHENLTERLRRREAGMLEMWSRDSGHA